MSEIIIYEDTDGQASVQVRLDGETVWLTQKQMAGLFESSTDNIGLHLKNIYAEGELSEPATAEDYSVVQTEGKRQVSRTIKHYNLDAIISVGYRVNSKRGVRFRQWATSVLRRHFLQGYTLNQSHLAELGINEAQQALGLLMSKFMLDSVVICRSGRKQPECQELQTFGRLPGMCGPFGSCPS
ncbi:MAG: hypothetical protein A2X56_14545 [Nitrospirae bacterium GWC2_57_13]|jgi:hypothetical protein|nr:MAG: hypothetical protein A2072_04790 [Nitrospirae bacterium GWC1_57_7]OGW27532.1 MAG: hypothetical protein A2X56_14545 [Nitrospirae bacterium GWC2_57_13]OGW42681.1 MAG: hypothetical protein A2X57_08620 [Nitrospirae bacterium GWD2_57_8]HAR45854.1 death-on-curing protein [Nitrospiraceae bacterium]